MGRGECPLLLFFAQEFGVSGRRRAGTALWPPCFWPPPVTLPERRGGSFEDFVSSASPASESSSVGPQSRPAPARLARRPRLSEDRPSWLRSPEVRVGGPAESARAALARGPWMRFLGGAGTKMPNWYLESRGIQCGVGGKHRVAAEQHTWGAPGESLYYSGPLRPTE